MNSKRKGKVSILQAFQCSKSILEPWRNPSITSCPRFNLNNSTSLLNYLTFSLQAYPTLIFDIIIHRHQEVTWSHSANKIGCILSLIPIFSHIWPPPEGWSINWAFLFIFPFPRTAFGFCPFVVWILCGGFFRQIEIFFFFF